MLYKNLKFHKNTIQIQTSKNVMSLYCCTGEAWSKVLNVRIFLQKWWCVIKKYDGNFMNFSEQREHFLALYYRIGCSNHFPELGPPHHYWGQWREGKKIIKNETWRSVGNPYRGVKTPRCEWQRGFLRNIVFSTPRCHSHGEVSFNILNISPK